MSIEELPCPLPVEGLDEQETIKLGIDICQALKSTGSAGIPYAPITPDDILFCGDEGYKLKSAGSGRPDDTPGETAAIYTAPETIDGASSAASWIYSLGMTMCTVVNRGRALFEPDPDDPAGSIPARLPDIAGISYSFMRILRRMCAADPSARYSSADSCLAELEELLRRQKDDAEKGRNSREQQNTLPDEETVDAPTAEPVSPPDIDPGETEDTDGFDPDYVDPGYAESGYADPVYDSPEYDGQESFGPGYGYGYYDEGSDTEDDEDETVGYMKRVVTTAVVIILLMSGLLIAFTRILPYLSDLAEHAEYKTDRPEQTQSEPSSDVKNFMYHKLSQGGGIAVDKYIGSKKAVTVPAEIDGVKVTEISSDAFSGSEIEKLVFHNGVKTISSGAFSDCSQLVSLELPQTLVTIGDSAFSGCSSLETVNIPEGVLTIGDSAFRGCISLREAALPSTIGVIGREVFRSCPKLETVSVPSDSKSFAADEFGVLYNKSFSELYLCPAKASFSSTGGVYKLPSTVTCIRAYAFSQVDGLISLEIPESGGGTGTVRIEPNAFLYCSSLYVVSLSSRVSSIGDDAFKFCKSLNAINVSPDNANYSSDAAGALYNKDQTVLIRYPQARISTAYVLPSTVERIYNCAFTSCGNLKTIVLPDLLAEIGSYAFDGCTALETLVLPDSLVIIRSYAFANCRKLTSMVIPDSVEEIGSGAFARCKITVFAPCEAEQYGGAPYDSGEDTEVVWTVISGAAPPLDGE